MQECRVGRLNGRFVVTWWEADGRKRHRLASLTLKEAEAEAIDVVRRETIKPATVTVKTLWEAYQQHLGKRPCGVSMGFTGKAILPVFGELRPDQITIEHCRSYMALRKKAGIKPGSTWTELGHLRSCMVWAAEKAKMIPHAPYIERPQKPAPKDRWLTEPEIQRLLTATAEQPHLRLAVLMMLGTAGRVGSILDLTWDRVDMVRGQINLRVDQEGPRKGRAVVPMNATLRAALTVAKEAAMSDYVIEWAGGQIKRIATAFNKAVKRADLENVSPHVLRHTAGVHMAAAGVPMARISQFMGHTSTAVTERVYARFAPEHLQEASDVLDFGRPRLVQ